MLSTGAAVAPKALWCPEYLAESPSTASTYADALADCAAPHRFQRSVKKRPFSVLPNNTTVETCVWQARQSEDIIFQKQQALEEKLNSSSRGFVNVDLDKTVHWDPRALNALLHSERCNFNRLTFGPQRMIEVQGDSNYVAYKTEVTKWILDVCTEENSDFNVLPLAITYLNRVLAVQQVPIESLQALAAACLFIASKMKAPHPVGAQRVSDYTDGFVTVDALLNWEMLTVNLLHWDLSLQTAFEFFDQLMVRAPVLEAIRDSFCSIAYTIQTDDKLSRLLPSEQAALGVCYLCMNSPKWFKFRQLLQDTLKVDLFTLKKFLKDLDPSLSNADLNLLQPMSGGRRRRSLLQQKSTFLALV